jgi:hypothetical protein
VLLQGKKRKIKANIGWCDILHGRRRIIVFIYCMYLVKSSQINHIYLYMRVCVDNGTVGIII